MRFWRRKHKSINLDQLRIASPCNVGWANMRGDEKVRFCDKCQLHVYNVTIMGRAQAEDFFSQRVGQRTCVHAYRRTDGTILLQDCPIGRRLARRAAAKLAGTAAAAIAALFTILHFAGMREKSVDRIRQAEPIKTVESCLAVKAVMPAVPPPPGALGDKSDGGMVP